MSYGVNMTDFGGQRTQSVNNVRLSKWWRTRSAQAAMRRASKAKKERLKTLRKSVKQKKGNNSK